MTDKERGAASLTITLSDGDIEVRHGDDDSLLAFLQDAPAGTWDRLWRSFEQLGLNLVFRDPGHDPLADTVESMERFVNALEQLNRTETESVYGHAYAKGRDYAVKMSDRLVWRRLTELLTWQKDRF